jgi:hypothetical protein
MVRAADSLVDSSVRLDPQAVPRVPARIGAPHTDSSPSLWSVLFCVWMAEFVVLLVFGVRELIRRDRIGMRYLKSAIDQNLIAK